MTFEQFIGLSVFAGIAAFTPGPNNTLLMASGMRFGFKRSLPLVLGVTFGFPVMIGLIGLGLGQVFEKIPGLYSAMKYAGAAYMLWLAFKIATAKLAADPDSIDDKPMSFLNMVMFQWINPKGWVMAVTALSAYTLASSYYWGVAVVVAVFFVMGIGSATVWAMFGASLRNIMRNPKYFQLINIVLALSLVASLVPMLRH
jgi:threonine/homoserine/homoserine lactone efflux protein